jgi:hypothetical protein
MLRPYLRKMLTELSSSAQAHQQVENQADENQLSKEDGSRELHPEFIRGFGIGESAHSVVKSPF